MQTEADVYELRRAVASILDVVEEIAVAMQTGTTPDGEWVSVVQRVFGEHRLSLGVARGNSDYTEEGHWVR